MPTYTRRLVLRLRLSPRWPPRPWPKANIPTASPIEMTALFGAASASTQTARVLADGMAKILGVPVPIVDKPGAGGAVGYTYLSQQKPDGYSIVWSSNSISTTFHNGQLPFDYKNFEHVARVTVENPALAVKADAPWKTLKELVEFAKANPEKVRVGNSGQGSQTHIASVALFTSAGAKIIPVHRTGGQATADLLGGRIEVAVQFPQALSCRTSRAATCACWPCSATSPIRPSRT